MQRLAWSKVEEELSEAITVGGYPLLKEITGSGTPAGRKYMTVEY